MTVLAPEQVTLTELLRDVRHLDARAAGDLADWLVYLGVEGKAPKTLYDYQRTVARLLRACPDTPIHEFTSADINDVLLRVPERSRHIVRSTFNTFFEWAENSERLGDRHPMRGVPRIRHPKRRPRDIFSVEEVALLEQLPMPDGQLFTILFGTGIRKGEARHLRRDHIALDRQRLVVYRGKGGKDRIIPLPPVVLAAIADLDLLERLRPDDYLWYTQRGSRRWRRDPMADTTFSNWWARGLEQAGVRYLNIHQTRHTFGHLLRERGFDIEERALLMGHEKIETTQRYYGTLTIEDVAKKVALL